MQTTLSMFCKAIATLGLSLSFTACAHAQSITTCAAKPPVKIWFAGVQNDTLLFDVYLEALSPKAVLYIHDEDGNLLHREAIRSSSFKRRYKVLPYNLKRVSFEVSSPGAVHSQSFDIAVRFEETLVVTAAR